MAEYNNKLQTNNTELQAILNTINNLPEAGSGGGESGEVEMCTITYEVVIDGLPPLELEDRLYVLIFGSDGTLSDKLLTTAENEFSVPKNSIIMVFNYNGLVIMGSVFFNPPVANIGSDIFYNSDKWSPYFKNEPRIYLVTQDSTITLNVM